MYTIDINYNIYPYISCCCLPSETDERNGLTGPAQAAEGAGTYIYIYHRFIVRFPIRLDFLFITFLPYEYWSRVSTTGCPSSHQPHAWDAISNSCGVFVSAVATFIYILNRPLVVSYDVPG